MIKNVIYLSLLLTTSIYSKDYEVNRNGNVNVNVIDRQVIVNGEVVETIPEDQPIDIKVDNLGVKVNDKSIKSNVGEEVHAGISEDAIGANVGDDIGVKIDKNSINANVEGISVGLGNIIGNILEDKDDKEEKKRKKKSDFFDGDPFFSE
jgi:hypothetical protein